MHGIHLSQMIKTLAKQTSGMGCEGQRTVEQHTEAHCFSGDLDADIPERNYSLQLKLIDSCVPLLTRVCRQRSVIIRPPDMICRNALISATELFRPLDVSQKAIVEFS